MGVDSTFLPLGDPALERRERRNWAALCACMWVCVCVCEREGERGGGDRNTYIVKGGGQPHAV